MVVVPPLNALLFHVQVTLWNTGEDAYQHHLYGDWITIERVIKTAGGTQYKLINSAGKKVGEVVVGGGGARGGVMCAAAGFEGTLIGRRRSSSSSGGGGGTEHAAPGRQLSIS
jgi:hypothetical protein